MQKVAIAQIWAFRVLHSHPKGCETSGDVSIQGGLLHSWQNSEQWLTSQCSISCGQHVPAAAFIL